MDQAVIESDVLDGVTSTERHGDEPTCVSESKLICFGNYSVCPGARALKLGGSEVVLGSRAFDLLVVLLRSRGRLVTKDEIVREVWPSIFVDESNLRFQMGVLRKALGAERDRIKTIPGRGYIFVEDERAPPNPVAPQTAPVLVSSAPAKSFILIVEPNADDRNAMTALLRALKVSVLSFKSVEELAAFTVGPMRLAAA
ncbi:winged helix-turn-helix domain-containing protein [Sphingomonas sp. UYP23]